MVQLIQLSIGVMVIGGMLAAMAMSIQPTQSAPKIKVIIFVLLSTKPKFFALRAPQLCKRCLRGMFSVTSIALSEVSTNIPICTRPTGLADLTFGTKFVRYDVFDDQKFLMPIEGFGIIGFRKVVQNRHFEFEAQARLVLDNFAK